MKSPFLWLLCVTVTGCAAQPSEPIELAETSWMMKLPATSHCDLPPTLEFSSGKVTGELGCNRVKATYVLQGSALTFQGITQTKKRCSKEAMAHEAAMLRVLHETRRIERVGEDLRFLTEDGKEILTLTPEVLGACR